MRSPVVGSPYFLHVSRTSRTASAPAVLEFGRYARSMTDRLTLLGWLDDQQSHRLSDPSGPSTRERGDEPVTKVRGEDQAFLGHSGGLLTAAGGDGVSEVETKQRGDEPEPHTATRGDD